MGKGVIEVTPELLLEHFMMLKGYKLTGVELDSYLKLTVEHPELPETAEGQVLLQIILRYKSYYDDNNGRYSYELDNVDVQEGRGWRAMR